MANKIIIVGEFRSPEQQRIRNLENSRKTGHLMAKRFLKKEKGSCVTITGDIECANTIAQEFHSWTSVWPVIIAMPKEVLKAGPKVISDFISHFQFPTVITTKDEQ